VFAKGLSWALRYDGTATPSDAALQTRALEHGLKRVAALEAGRTPWVNRKGKLVRGYFPRLTGRCNPSASSSRPGTIPRSRRGSDVVLHGSSKPVGMSELRFMSRFDEDGEALRRT